MRYGVVILLAGSAGLLAFTSLAVAIGTDYWYIVDVNKPNRTDRAQLSSHSGLWRINEGENSTSDIPSFPEDTSGLSEFEKHLFSLHKAVVVLLPLSLVLLVFGWIFGLVSSLARSPKLLSGVASYLLFCSVFTLSGVCVYISFSHRALEEFERVVSPEDLAYVHASFGWSLVLAWLAYSLEVAAGLLLLLAARTVYLREHRKAAQTV